VGKIDRGALRSRLRRLANAPDALSMEIVDTESIQAVDWYVDTAAMSRVRAPCHFMLTTMSLALGCARFESPPRMHRSNFVDRGSRTL